MVFDAHVRAFVFWRGTCTRGIYDDRKTAADAVFVGKKRTLNRRFQQMRGHYLADPTACSPAAGWEKGQGENQVGTTRDRLFCPWLRVASMQELNDLLVQRIIAWTRIQPHPEIADKTVREIFAAERPSLVPYRGTFDGFHEVTAAVSKTRLVRFDHNKYPVEASAVGRPVEVHAYADRIDLRQDGCLIARHPRCFSRGATVYDPWHSVPVLTRKPEALRNGAPFRHWVLPRAIEKVRARLRGIADGDRQMVQILAAAMTDGLAAVEGACAEALAHGVHSADVGLNILARHRDPEPAAPIATPETLRLRCAPDADCARYDSLRSIH